MHNNIMTPSNKTFLCALILRAYSRSSIPVTPEHIHKTKVPKHLTHVSRRRAEYLKELGNETEHTPGVTVEELQAHHSYNQFKIKMMMKKMQLKTIERKYFQRKETPDPNLLTWDMKEHLLFLHATDPEEWNPFALSETFPISVDGVKKLIRRPNKPLTPEKRNEHDLEVLENWRRMTKGRIGSLGVLRNVIKQRMSTKSDVTLPAPVSTPDEVIGVLKNLEFTPTDDLFASAVEDRNPVVNKKKRITMTSSFKDIISKYNAERQSKKEENQQDNWVQLKKCKDLEEVLPKLWGNEQIPSSAMVTVRLNSSAPDDQNTTRKSPLQKLKRHVTFEEYKRLKNNLK